MVPFRCVSDFFGKEKYDTSKFIVLNYSPTRSLLLMTLAHNLIDIYLAIELQSLCFYVTTT
jgi:NADH-ubiquinone oxidoreductase chain 2